jgi:HNH endonuclease
MNKDLARLVRERAGSRCEYCLLPEAALPLPFQIDHITAEKHGGQTVDSNLALACPQISLGSILRPTRWSGFSILEWISGQNTLSARRRRFWAKRR